LDVNLLALNCKTFRQRSIECCYLIWDERIDAAIAAITLDQVNAAFRKRIDVSKLSIVKAGDFKAAGVFQP
jgi:hypothetical protein